MTARDDVDLAMADGAAIVRDTWAEIRGERNEPRAGPDYAATLAPHYFNYRKTSIYAGSNEIQHNIMAKMVLGL
jgi:alkylation response protein AidB-like acyl-CoA dehydrogenase